LGHRKLVTDKYSFTLADAPGHQEFIDQMVRGAEEANAVVLVIDAREGIQEQTIQHLRICHEAGIDDVIILVNKMDLFGYDKAQYEELERNIINMLYDMGYGKKHIIPCSALNGENIARASDKMPWYEGMTLLGLLEAHFKDRPALGLDELIAESGDVIYKAITEYNHPILLWAGGKDSTVMLDITRKLCRESMPIVMFLDTGYQFRETYEYIHKLAKKWDIKVYFGMHLRAVREGYSPNGDKFECCHQLKTLNLYEAIKNYNADAVIVGIRWDEHGVRGKETHFSPRQEPIPHMRIHPMLNWSEKEIWEYIKRENVPYNPLYDKVFPGGKVIRSIGCEPCTKPMPMNTIGERAGRSLDKENFMQSLRQLGYM